jgi:hypothetical protein
LSLTHIRRRKQRDCFESELYDTRLDSIPVNCGIAELGYDKFIVRAPKNNTSKNAELMQCPECHSTHINKTGQKKGKRNYICVGFVADNL